MGLKKKVMVVDDEKSIVDLFEVIQEVCDFQVVAEAYTGEEAVETYSKLRIKPDVVIMDERMPGMNGLEATKKILAKDRSAKIIFVSGDPKIEDKALSMGASAFMTKPFGLNELKKVIESVSKEERK
ncbi:MAG: response regulator [Thermoplasmata archaeon]